MNKWIIFTIIVVIIFAIIILDTALFANRILKKGKKAEAKIIKIEKEKNMSASHDDPGIMRHWFNLEIELNGKILKRQVAITNYTKKLKSGDSINVIVHNNDFLLEDELENYKKYGSIKE